MSKKFQENSDKSEGDEEMISSNTVPNSTFGSKQMNNSRGSSTKKNKEYEQKFEPETESNREIDTRERVKIMNK